MGQNNNPYAGKSNYTELMKALDNANNNCAIAAEKMTETLAKMLKEIEIEANSKPTKQQKETAKAIRSMYRRR